VQHRAPSQPLTDAGPRGLVPILLAAIPFSQIPLDAYTPALPQTANDLATTSVAVQDTVTAYMLGLIAAGLLAAALPGSLGSPSLQSERT
jgi:MFS transporter, DHA1 family, multidrug resistance protein